MLGINLKFDKLNRIDEVPFDGNVQIMTGSPHTTKRDDLSELVPFSRDQRIDKLNSVIHASLCLNPCRSDFNGFTLRYLQREIEIANLLNIRKIIIHPRVPE